MFENTRMANGGKAWSGREAFAPCSTLQKDGTSMQYSSGIS